MYKTLHLCYYELSPAMRAEIKRLLKNNYRYTLEDQRYKKLNNHTDKEINKIINNHDYNKLFDTNNAGINIEAPAYMIY